MPVKPAPAVLLAFLCVLPARAQPIAQAPEWSDVESVTVQARPGPAVWHVSRGNSEVWILPVVGQLPKGLEWNRDYLSDLLDGANAILTRPRPNVNVVDIGWFLLTRGSELSLPRGQTLEANLPEDLRARFVAARKAVAIDEDDYRTDTPLRAGVRLLQDMNKRMRMDGGEPNDTINRLARNKRIERRPITRFDVMDAARDVLKLSPQQQQACLSQAVEDVHWALAHADAAGRAWAVGDVKGIKTHFRESQGGNCIMAAVGRIADIDARNVAEFVTAIDAALANPGKTVVIIRVDQLLRKGAVLDRLKASGATIEAPAE
jgi:uncharacterized protein YbaP (TraB family)